MCVCVRVCVHLDIEHCQCCRPGGQLNPGESDEAGIKRILTDILGHDNEEFQPTWEVCTICAVYIRVYRVPLQVQSYACYLSAIFWP
jgi:hypothetical protein